MPSPRRPLPDQRPARVRLEWGAGGASALAGVGTLAVVVDVLSFSTAVTVACAGGTVVHPYPLRDPAGAAALAARLGATLAARRGDGRVSLSPASLRGLGPGRLVLPSPNGATVSLAAAAAGAGVVLGCLRNAAAVGRAAAEHLAADASHDVLVVPAGERWPDGSLRPALEDLLGAGAVVTALVGAAGESTTSPEAAAAATLWRSAPDPVDAVRRSTSGRELVDAGWGDDVRTATALDADACVPRLADDGAGPAFRP
ncbi:2-phosphosulfolactate phosphatase [Cellulomonas shaoxiangyii]|uniref:Probable 2-phosphosulfolactate phosphatase n=1 Tax=Cellulomonas shaoxiangyii TaxID=2566013 RepID=A0A4P7SPC1_9CELL|nr:2-phosphosulfolactate phosphatase [Cellulomonas shaoxiangyii]QCB94824.1 hypothetical protein E5225_15890 [Cellulomonas shaoxiangyii]TGY86554.1 hypothetical protein E5226_01915 [Cellulomonas shaoxiangyii]